VNKIPVPSERVVICKQFRMIRVTSKYSCTYLAACSWDKGVTSVTLYWCMSRVLCVRVRERYSAATGIVHMVLLNSKPCCVTQYDS